MDNSIQDQRCSVHSDRRKRNDVDRRKSSGSIMARGEIMLGTSSDTNPLRRACALSNYEKALGQREKALVIGEIELKDCENDLHRCEVEFMSEQSKSFVHRVQEISDSQLVKLAQESLHTTLREANEHLVIASLQSQVNTEHSELSNVMLSHLANHDFLTNLPNRLQLYDRINIAIGLAIRHSQKLAVLFVDLDHFKAVNDKFGHAIGDIVLQAVAQRLTESIRSSDTVSRLGGDEFVLVLTEVTDTQTLADNVRKIHSCVIAPYAISERVLEIGASIGVSIFPNDGDDTETLIRNADEAMYFAKEAGRNKCQFFSEKIRSRFDH